MVDTQFGAVKRYAPLLSLALGALASTGFAPLDWWPIALIALAAWMWLVHDAASLKQALWRGWLFGVGHFTLNSNWIQHAFTYQDAMPHWLGYIGVVLLALVLAIYPMIAAGLAWRFGRAPGSPDTAFVLILAASWIAAEWLRATLLTGYAWDPLGVIWLPVPGIAALSRIVGTYALSGVTIVLAGALMVAVTRRWRFPVAIACLAVVALAIGMPTPPPASRAADAPRIRVVQPNIGQEGRPDDDYPEMYLRALLARVGKPGPAPRLIVWPEGAVQFMLEDGYPQNYYWRGQPLITRMRIAALLGANDIVLTGGDAAIFDTDGELTAAANSIFAIDRHARIIGRYDKAHLVPFGEYLPLRPLLSRIGLDRIVPGDIDFRGGFGPRALDLPHFGLVGMQICYEIIFSGQVTDRNHRPAFLFNPSNDSWFGSWGPPQHLAQARMRAIEEGLPVIRSTPTGISAIIGADGALLATVPSNTAGAIELPIPKPLPPTLFARVGNIMAFAVALILLLLGVAIRRRSR